MILTILERLPAARWVLIAALANGGMGGIQATLAQAAGDGVPASLAAQEKQECIRNLTTIYAAIEAYQIDHKDVPNWLSDLVPRYLTDANVLVCPVCRRTGKTEAPPLADPNISSSYLYEFCPVPLGASAPNAATRTRREWKRRQMGLVGSKVPIIRCRHHDPLLNLAFDGAVYESPLFWEWAFTNRVSAADLTAARIFANDAPSGLQLTNNAAPPRKFPPRDEKARPQLLDLSRFYNAMLSESWHGGRDNDLSALPVGLQNLNGVDFDIRGIVQLSGKGAAVTNFPTEVTGIEMRQKCSRLHFVHAAGWGHGGDEGKQIGSYVVHYATNQIRLEIPIIYGRALRDWHAANGEPPSPKELVVAWKGENGVSKRAGSSVRLFLTTWTNVLPDLEIGSIDFVSSMSDAAPFLVAITAE